MCKSTDTLNNDKESSDTSTETIEEIMDTNNDKKSNYTSTETIEDIYNKEITYWQHWVEHERTAIAKCLDKDTLHLLEIRLQSAINILDDYRNKLAQFQKEGKYHAR